MCDTKILMVADEEDRKKRVMARDSISVEYLNKRDSAGINYDDIEFDQIIYTSEEDSNNGQTI
jgi:dephospho-CoA kinase